MSMCQQTYWRQLLTVPDEYKYERQITHIKNYEFETFNAESYWQNNGPGTVQRVVMTLPKNISGKTPAVVIPFYYPEAMVGFDLDTLEEEPLYRHIAMSRLLSERGFITITGEAYYLTMLPEDKSPRDEFQRWKRSSSALLKKYPQWSDCGKLVADTQLLIDMLENDPRADHDRIGIAGHSLGGKVAFYTGCIDKRIKAILANDFGMNWDQSNWHEDWYWGSKIEKFIAEGIDHSQLLTLGGGKPFMLLAGKADDQASLDTILRSNVYEENSDKLDFINHASGHNPPVEVLEKGLDFLAKHLHISNKAIS